MSNSSDPRQPTIDRLDFDTNRGTVRSNRSRASGRSGGQRSERSLLDDDVDFMDEVAYGILDRDRKRMRREVIRTVSLVCAVLSWYGSSFHLGQAGHCPSRLTQTRFCLVSSAPASAPAP